MSFNFTPEFFFVAKNIVLNVDHKRKDDLTDQLWDFKKKTAREKENI
jgi:hypothetical protein